MIIENGSGNKKRSEVTAHNFIRFKDVPINKEYKLVKKLAKAAFGEIYLVIHKETKSHRCLKLYDKKKMQNTNQNQFEEEINIIKDLDHPNIFKIFEFYQDSNNFYLITEYLEGGELFEYITNAKKMSEATVFLIME